MKKAFLFLLAFSIGMVSFAQNSAVAMLSATYGLATDTVNSTTAHYLVSPSKILGFVKVAAIVVTGTEISGTTGGTASLEASIDGVNYYSASSTTYTFTDTTAAQPFGWTLVDAPARWYRVKVVGVSTPSFKITAKQLTVKN